MKPSAEKRPVSDSGWERECNKEVENEKKGESNKMRGTVGGKMESAELGCCGNNIAALSLITEYSITHQNIKVQHPASNVVPCQTFLKSLYVAHAGEYIPPMLSSQKLVFRGTLLLYKEVPFSHPNY